MRIFFPKGAFFCIVLRVFEVRHVLTGGKSRLRYFQEGGFQRDVIRERFVRDLIVN